MHPNWGAWRLLTQACGSDIGHWDRGSARSALPIPPSYPHFDISGCGVPINVLFGASDFGWNFCVRPPNVSATYKLP